MRVLVTGGAGFIGSNLVHALLASGHETGVVDDLSSGKPENLHPASWMRTLDILDPRFPSTVADFAPEAVVHLAAQSSVAASLKDPERDWAVNAEGTAVVARAAREAGARTMLSASSAAVYGEPAFVPLTETAPVEPINPYGRSKLEAEARLAAELGGSNVDFASFRFSNVYGPRQDAQGEGGVVAVFCDVLRRGAEPVVDGSGEQTRDFIFVGDIIAAIIGALEKPVALAEGRGAGPAYNISTGGETSINELGRHLAACAGYEADFGHGPARDGDIVRSVLDPSKAERVFDWTAGVVLARGLELTWRWFAAQAFAGPEGSPTQADS